MSATDSLVIDAVLHAYNLTDDNYRDETAKSLASATYGLLHLTGDAGLISEQEYNHDWSVDEVAQLAFVESDIDLAVYHGVPLDDYFRDGLSSNEKGVEMKRRWPERVMFYGAINPFEGEAALEKAEFFVKECGASGLKFYPERYSPDKPVEPMLFDDPKIWVFLEKAIELGVPVAVHKFAAAGPGRADNYRLGDIEYAAKQYPELQFEVVHSGFAFLEETSMLLQRFPNVWANLEMTTALIKGMKGRFTSALGQLLASGAGDRIVFATGCSLLHPQPIIDELRALEMPRDLVEGWGYPPLTDGVKAGILGGNYCRLHNIDVEATRRAIADDEFAKHRAEFDGRRWSKPAWLRAS